MADIITKTPTPPYYAVIFTSKRTNGDNGYAAIADEVVKLAEQQPGFLGADSVRHCDAVNITVSYWDSFESIQSFKNATLHAEAQKKKALVFDFQLTCIQS